MISILIAILVKIIEIALPEFIRWEWAKKKKHNCIRKLNYMKFKKTMTVEEIAKAGLDEDMKEG